MLRSELPCRHSWHLRGRERSPLSRAHGAHTGPPIAGQAISSLRYPAAASPIAGQLHVGCR